MKKRWISLMVLGTMFLCAACGLFPAEEEYPNAPVLTTTERQYVFTEVKRGDLTEEKRIVVNYTAQEEQDVVFSEEGEVTLYVEKGAEVTKGQLLAQRNADTLLQEIETQKRVLAGIQETLEEARWRGNWLQERKEILMEAAETEPERYGLLLENNQQEIEGNKEELEILQQSYSFEKKVLLQKQADLEKRQIYAAFDGVVSYTRNGFEEGGTDHVAEERVVATVINPASAIFLGSMDEKWVEEGDSIQITIDYADYEACVESVVQSQKGKWELALRMEKGGPQMKVGDSGSFHVVIKSVQDVLYLPQVLIHDGEGIQYIYYLNEDGIKSIKEVKVGQKVGGMVEILSGLKEGEKVIR